MIVVVVTRNEPKDRDIKTGPVVMVNPLTGRVPAGGKGMPR